MKLIQKFRDWRYKREQRGWGSWGGPDPIDAPRRGPFRHRPRPTVQAAVQSDRAYTVQSMGQRRADRRRRNRAAREARRHNR